MAFEKSKRRSQRKHEIMIACHHDLRPKKGRAINPFEVQTCFHVEEQAGLLGCMKGCKHDYSGILHSEGRDR